MKLAIMQPYFMPYIGYWQLLAAVDVFVLYDNIQYTKKGWMNRNRFLRDGADALFTLPVAKGSESLHVVERSLADSFDRRKLLNQLSASYRRAPEFSSVFPVIETVVMAEQDNLFQYIYHSIRVTAQFLGIHTPIVVSSMIDIDHALRGEDKVLELCRVMGSTTYINSIGGQALYSRDRFRENGIALQFLRTQPIRYVQFGDVFVENLSVIDVMMFNTVAAIREMLGRHELV